MLLASYFYCLYVAKPLQTLAVPPPEGFRGHLSHGWSFTRELFSEYSDDNCFRLAAALSYYAIFSLAPILIIIISTAGVFFGRDAVSGEVFNQAKDLVGAEGADTIQNLVQHAYLEKSGFLTTVVSIVTLILSATATFGVIQDSLNTVWKIKVKPERGIVKFLLTRVLSFAMVLMIGFLLMVSLVLNAVLVALQDYIARLLDQFSVYAIQLGQTTASLCVVIVLFAMMFKYLPDVIIPWRNVWKASILTAVLFTVGKSLIGFYLGRSNLATTYGAAASIIIIMLWVNYSAWIFFLGAEYIYVSMRRSGERIVPSRFAVRQRMVIEEEDREGHIEKLPVRE